MTDEPTLHQSDDEMSSARSRSVRRDGPPAEIPGYDLEYCLGSGAYGEVWAAVDRNTRRKVAIKFYTQRRNVDVSMLSREVEKLARLSADRYVVQLLDVGWNSTPPYYVMDYIENGSLEDLLRDNGALPKQQALNIFHDVLVGLMHLHNKGILHCDLKPGNVLLDSDLNPRLADFGQSRLNSEQAPALGTLFYMAPEQADLNAIPDVRWDIYSAGVLLYCMLAGHPPHRDDEFLEYIQRIDGVEQRLVAYRKQISKQSTLKQVRAIAKADQALVDILEKCLAPTPSRRFQSAQGVLAALKQREAQATRRPLMILGLGAPLILLMVMLSFFWFMYRQAKSDTDAAILDKAGESNRWAAQLAASSASAQIDRYFKAVVDLSKNRQLRTDLAELLSGADFQAAQPLLANPRKNSDEALNSYRQTLAADPAGLRIHQLLRQRIADPEFPASASLFIVDKYGTQVATSFEGTAEAKVLGRNYSYRTYFSGLSYDLDYSKEEDFSLLYNTQLARRQHINTTYVSAAFPSTANGHWKVAFTCPVFEGEEFIGVVAVTVDTGSFVEFDNGSQQYAMLVDARDGVNCGTILEHPFLSRTIDDGRLVPDGVFDARVVRSSLDQDHGIFVDPIGQLPEQDADSISRSYQGRWIAGTSKVTSHFGNYGAGSKQETGLIVIAAENYQAVLQPSQKLSDSLIRLATWSLLTLFTIFFALAWFALRTIRQVSGRFITGDFGSTEVTATTR